MTLFKDIKNDLPNFPDEVIQDWLLPFANDIKWPPKHPRWEAILFGRAVEFWQAKKWEKRNIDLSKIIFSQETKKISDELYKAYILGQNNLYVREIKNGKLRCKDALSYLFESGKFPKPIQLLFEQNQYSIVDGNHRFVAWYCASQLAREIENAEKEQKQKIMKTIQKKLKIKSTTHISIEQEVWIAH